MKFTASNARANANEYRETLDHLAADSLMAQLPELEKMIEARSLEGGTAMYYRDDNLVNRYAAQKLIDELTEAGFFVERSGRVGHADREILISWSI